MTAVVLQFPVRPRALARAGASGIRDLLDTLPTPQRVLDAPHGART